MLDAVLHTGNRAITAELDLRFLPVMSVCPKPRRAWWRSAQPIVMDSDQFVCDHTGDWWRGPHDLSAKLYFAWNPEHLLFAADVTDDVHCQPYPDGTMYHGDCVQLFLDVLKNGSARTAESDDYDILLGDTPLGPLVYAASVPPDRLPLLADADLRIRRGPKGNRFYDLKLPASSIKDLRLASGTVLGATVVVNDNDGHGRRGWLELTPEAGTTRDIRSFLNLVLCDEEFLGRPPCDAMGSGQKVRLSIRAGETVLQGDGLSETTLTVDARDGRRLPEPALVRLSIPEGGTGILSSHTVQAGHETARYRAPIDSARRVEIQAVPLDHPGQCARTTIRVKNDRDHLCVLGRLNHSLRSLRTVERCVAQDDLTAAAEALLAYFRSRADLALTADQLRVDLSEEQRNEVIESAQEVVERIRKGGSNALSEMHTEGLRFSRLAFWHELGQAYLLTDDERFCRAFVRAFRYSYKSLPAAVNGHEPPAPWASLCTGLRLSNAVAAYRCFLSWPGLTPEVHSRYLRLLLSMAYFLEARHGPANWMSMEAAGLANCAFRFPEFVDSSRWTERVRFLAEGQAIAQVRRDGMHYEQSPGYHLVVQNSWMQILELADGSGAALSPRFRKTLEKMHDVCLYLAQPDWRLPNLGDSGEPDVREALAAAATVFGRRDFRYPDGRPIRPPRKASVPFPHAGYCVMRSDWSPDAAYLCIDYGPWGYPNGHSHEDSLSLTLYALGRRLVVETGVLSYVRDEWREYFAGAAGHNTCTVDGRGQGFVDAELLTWRTSRELDFADGLHRGYAPVIHRRAVLFLKPDYWLLLDAFLGDGKRHTIHQHFHFMPSETVAGARVCHKTLAAHSGYQDTNVLILPVNPSGLRVEKRDGWYCGHGSEGEKVSAPEVCYTARKRLPLILGTLLIPYRGLTPPDVQCDVQMLKAPAKEAEPIRARLRVRLPHREDVIRLPLARARRHT